MDYKQRDIYARILKENNIEGKTVFIQHRNLNEFRGFEVERINPTHRIMLFGRLRRHRVKDRQYNKLLNVGEIIVYSAFLVFPFNSFWLSFLNGYVVWLLFSRLCLETSFVEVFNAYWDRGERGKRKDAVSRPLSV